MPDYFHLKYVNLGRVGVIGNICQIDSNSLRDDYLYLIIVIANFQL